MALQKRCLNCSLSLKHRRIVSREVFQLSTSLRELLMSWTSLLEVCRMQLKISAEHRVCEECFNILHTDEPTRSFGHRSICLGCGVSVLRARSIRLDRNRPEYDIIRNWVPQIQANLPIFTRVCRACWRRATRQLAHQLNAAKVQEELLDLADVVIDINDRNTTPVQKSPSQQCEPVHTFIENVEILACVECSVEIDECELYRCVQCPLVVMCARCGRDNVHAHHCVLRIPSLQVYNKMKDLFEFLGDVFNKKLCDDDEDRATAKVKNGRHDLKGRATAKVKSGRRKRSRAERSDVNITQTRTEAVAGPSPEPTAVVAETSGEPLIYLPEVKPEPNPDPLSCPLDPDPLTLSALDILSAPHQTRPEKRKTPKTTTLQIKKVRKKAIAETIVSVEQEELVVKDEKIEDPEPRKTDEVEAKQEPPDQDSFVFYASYPAGRSGFGT